MKVGQKIQQKLDEDTYLAFEVIEVSDKESKPHKLKVIHIRQHSEKISCRLDNLLETIVERFDFELQPYNREIFWGNEY